MSWCSVSEWIYSVLLLFVLFSFQHSLSHISKTLKPFFLYAVSSQFIKFSLLTATFDVLFGERWTYVLTRTKIMKRNHSFKDSFAMRKNPSTLKQSISLSLFVVWKLSFSRIWPCSLETGLDHIFEATGSVFSRCESTRL